MTHFEEHCKRNKLVGENTDQRQDSKFYADRFITKLLNGVDQLEKHPQSGRVVPEFGKEDIRELIEGNYRIIYRIQMDFVGIARIHHSARLLKEL
ncbi:MAG: type II toxin-antitoxin system RelE/ParE family toxin [Cytophagia bacterium]|nr:type II toxin-antitoxin system RelE/ParE family toxin [Cytophagia bacterium]